MIIAALEISGWKADGKLKIR